MPKLEESGGLQFGPPGVQIEETSVAVAAQAFLVASARTREERQKRDRGLSANLETGGYGWT